MARILSVRLPRVNEQLSTICKRPAVQSKLSDEVCAKHRYCNGAAS